MANVDEMLFVRKDEIPVCGEILRFERTSKGNDYVVVDLKPFSKVVWVKAENNELGDIVGVGDIVGIAVKPCFYNDSGKTKGFFGYRIASFIQASNDYKDVDDIEV